MFWTAAPELDPKVASYLEPMWRLEAEAGLVQREGRGGAASQDQVCGRRLLGVCVLGDVTPCGAAFAAFAV
ncbi:hypothetical protein NDU88_003074 [Pleurodeles waltl]|uniref:Uncharacterized protein n=1 Tax=Pleurodeles waltl TaxID=8319 RepID=A0AAV7M477_PLEWA|nr:hypothetical protein NDU88_003074 [Pleurodeles waltl]